VERTRLLEGQQKQIDSMISLLAGAIDAKSPHTGRHCSRVPELALMLAEAAEACESGPLEEFRFADEKDWREFRAAAWLHDCGKISTPEAVVDKATKLETTCNRIHEIRTRFEVLLRDARIAQLEAQLAGGDAQRLQQQYDRHAQQLQEDFRFVASCNLGSEGMDPEALERLRQLAGVTWWRHFDDRLGLGWEEASRCTEPVAPLPAPEPLLADKPRHRIPRPPEELPDPSWRFTLQAPELLYNQGEIHNLSILRGTLTPEELYKIREHMIHTIVMLESICFPPAMSRVAAIAGAHHETLTGTGYPRGLVAEQLSVPARILAIADIFEALTASDRPYKLGKTLSEAVGILAGFRDRSHIDPDLFELFLRSGVYLRYAQRFLPAHQIDPVDIHQHLR
jgi:response regulator RpfG family c-di-GMP phosphodiesterase